MNCLCAYLGLYQTGSTARCIDTHDLIEVGVPPENIKMRTVPWPKNDLDINLIMIGAFRGFTILNPPKRMRGVTTDLLPLNLDTGERLRTE